MVAGDQLPPERQLAIELGISRMTLRRAIDDLVASGAVRRRHGSGVFAMGPKLDQSLIASSFTQDMVARGLRPGSRVLAFDIAEAGPHLRRKLHLEEPSEVISIVRLRLADDEPLALEELNIPRDVMPDLEPIDLEDASFYQLLRDRHSITLTHSVQTIEPTLLDAREATDLGVATGSPALLFERISRSSEGRPVEYVRSVYRGDRYKIRTELTIPQEPTTPEVQS